MPVSSGQGNWPKEYGIKDAPSYGQKEQPVTDKCALCVQRHCFIVILF
jgi:hypothetical protein